MRMLSIGSGWRAIRAKVAAAVADQARQTNSFTKRRAGGAGRHRQGAFLSPITAARTHAHRCASDGWGPFIEAHIRAI